MELVDYFVVKMLESFGKIISKVILYFLCQVYLFLVIMVCIL